MCGFQMNKHGAHEERCSLIIFRASCTNVASPMLVERWINNNGEAKLTKYVLVASNI